MAMQSNQVGWYCGLQGPFVNKADALTIRKSPVKVGYKPQEIEAISYRVDESQWKSPNSLVKK
jgi:hypothetical protein